jgi:hypothetical protein
MTEVELLKSRLDLMNIKYHHKAGKSKLKELLEDAQVSEDLVVQEESNVQRNARLRKQASRLIRVNVTMMNPNKTNLKGEVYTVSNSIVGTHKKFVLFNTTDGYHVPYIIFKHMQERKYQAFKTVKGAGGKDRRVGFAVPELSIHVLDPLTPEELEELKIKQALNRSID